MPEGRRRRSAEPPRRFPELDVIREPADAHRVQAAAMHELQRRGGRRQEPIQRLPGEETGEIAFRPPQALHELSSPEQLVAEVTQGEDASFRQDVQRAVELVTAQGWVPTRQDIEAIADTIDQGSSPEQAARRFRMTHGEIE